jgi:FkbM family methyltransferase
MTCVFMVRFILMKTLMKQTAYGIAKTLARPVGFYPFPKTHRKHLVHLLDHLGIDCVLDVGAHFGEFGKLLRELRFKGQIISFEPVSASFQRLEAAAKGDPKWGLWPFALGASDGTSTIHIYRASDFNSLLSPANVSGRFEACTEELGVETIAIRRLDSVYDECLKGLASARVFLKMDTQGYDLEVVKGAAGVLPKILGMQSELPGIPHYANQPPLLEALSHYWAAGYRPTGFFPVNHETDGITVMEWDCLLVREGAKV